MLMKHTMHQITANLFQLYVQQRLLQAETQEIFIRYSVWTDTEYKKEVIH
jgi:hypothetical protein